MRQKREKDLECELVKAVESVGGLCYKFTSPNLPGVPDRIAMLPGGKIIFVEMKTHDGRTSGVQRWVHDKMTAVGCDVRIIKGQRQLDEFIAREVML